MRADDFTICLYWFKFLCGVFFIRSKLGDDSKRQKVFWCMLSWMREQMLPVPYWALINPSAVLRDCHKVLKKELLLLWPSCGSSCTLLQTHHRSHRRWEQQALCRQTDTGQVRRHVRLLLCVWWFVHYICFGAPLFIWLCFIVFNKQTVQQLVVTRINQDKYNLKYISSFLEIILYM